MGAPATAIPDPERAPDANPRTLPVRPGHRVLPTGAALSANPHSSVRLNVIIRITFIP